MYSRKRILSIAISVLVLAAAVLAYRLIEPRPVRASAVEVKIDNFSFSPTPLRVRVGTQITWVNRDDIPHSVVEDDKLFKSRVLDTDEKFIFIPSRRGRYKYYCSIHPKMTAELIVE